jgi:hypothetical protein
MWSGGRGSFPLQGGTQATRPRSPGECGCGGPPIGLDQARLRGSADPSHCTLAASAHSASAPILSIPLRERRVGRVLRGTADECGALYCRHGRFGALSGAGGTMGRRTSERLHGLLSRARTADEGAEGSRVTADGSRPRSRPLAWCIDGHSVISFLRYALEEQPLRPGRGRRQRTVPRR